jgi:hypothetical protein
MSENDHVKISDLLSIREVAAMTGVTRQAVYLWADLEVGRLARNGQRIFLPVTTVAGCYRVIHRDELQRFLADVA